jgi:uncharacterized protein YdeI (YjbR/CyaY-like superfamily)
LAFSRLNRMTAVTFFRSPSDFRKWLAQHHVTARELCVGYYKKNSGKRSITWSESVDEALCFGWIDGIRKSRDDLSYTIRFTPRKPKSTWSAVNIRRVQELARDRRMQPAGRKAFERRTPEKSGIYSYENRKNAVLNKSAEKQFRSSHAAWDFFQAQPPSYRQTAIWWVVSAKKEETRQTRLKKLIGNSACGKRL